MAASAFTLDGVEFKLSEDFKPKAMINLPCNILKKDIDFLLQTYNYDFSLEKNVILLDEAKKTEILEQKQKEIEIKKLKLEKSNKDTSTKMTNDGLNFSSILTPEKYTNAHKHDSPQHKALNVNDFVEENLDPFTNAELQTIDDFKELQDVLQNVTMGGLSGTSSLTSSSTPVSHLTPSNEIAQTSIESPYRRQHNTTPTSDSDMKNSITVSHSSPDLFGRVDVSSSSLLPNTMHSVSSLSVVSTTASIPLISNKPFHSEVSAQTGLLPADKSSLDVSTQSNQLAEQLSSNDSSTQNLTTFSNSTNVQPTLTVDISKKSNISEHNYVNVSDLKKPKVAPKPLQKSKSNKTNEEPSNYINLQLKPFDLSKTTNAVQNKVLANKSKAERTKFEETINKALTSLPTLPQSVVLSKAHQGAVKNLIQTSSVGVRILTAPDKPRLVNQSVEGSSKMANGQNSATVAYTKKGKSSNSILQALSKPEQEFAESIVAMGFKEEDVVRAMQKSGTDHKDVLDYLIKVQCLADKGFSIENIEDSLELFHGDVEEAEKYLTLQQQFLDMGFPKAKVKEALLIHNTDQTKALEELMSSV